MAAVAGQKDLKQALSEAMAIQGAMAVALVDINSGMVLDKAGGGALDLDVAGEGNSEVVRAKLRVKEQLGIRDDIEDILITLTSQYHLIRTLSSDANVFIYLVLNRATANLAMARRSLAQVDSGLVV
jgi:hypothetical protein